MIIAHVLSSFDLGGQERVALDLATAQQRSGERVLAISLAPGDGPLGAEFRARGVATQTLPKAHRVDPLLPLRIGRLLRSEHVDVVHTHNPAALVYGAPAGRLAGCAVLHSKHGINPDGSRRRRLRRSAAALVDAYVAVTPTLADVARSRHECATERLHVVENGIDVARFVPDADRRRRARADLGIDESARVIGSVGRLAPEKNQLLLLLAAEPLLDDSVHLLIVGDGPERGALAEWIGRSARRERIRLLGWSDDVAELLNAFDVFALSSDSEGLPLSLLEALASGLPVVSTRVGGIADVIEDGRSGSLVAPGDVLALRAALSSLLADPVHARELAERGRARVLERHSAERMAREYAALYRAIIGSRRLTRAGILRGAAPG